METTGTDQGSGEPLGHRPTNGSTAIPAARAKAGTPTVQELPATRPPADRPSPAPPALNVRYGRTALALAGFLALLGAVVTFPLAVFGVVAAAWPLLLGVTAVAATALLRTLAVRDRRARVNRAFAEAMWPETVRNPSYETVTAAPPRELPRVGRSPETALFDVEQPASPAPAGSAGPAGTDTGRDSAAGPHEEEPPRNGPDEDPERNGIPGGVRGTTWQPIDVPRPTYVDAAKAERSAPAPLELPDTPKPTGKTSFKESAAALAPGRPSSAADESASPSPAGKIDLDDILQRRRA